uniref:Apolipoprotein A-II n=1 Tax=Hucho hucho TaxID=62062 RepID=A0A4W5PVF6_9TELE
MNGKLALALVLALQVSVCLCQVPEPDKELVEKYEAMKSVFYKRLMNAFGKVQVAVWPMIESLGQGQGLGQAAKDYIEELQGNPKFLGAVKIGSGLAQEAAPLVDKARMAGLGLYGHYVRPHIGTYLDEAITSIKVYLDKVLPAEE